MKYVVSLSEKIQKDKDTARLMKEQRKVDKKAKLAEKTQTEDVVRVSQLACLSEKIKDAARLMKEQRKVEEEARLMEKIQTEDVVRVVQLPCLSEKIKDAAILVEGQRKVHSLLFWKEYIFDFPWTLALL